VNGEPVVGSSKVNEFEAVGGLVIVIVAFRGRNSPIYETKLFDLVRRLCSPVLVHVYRSHSNLNLKFFIGPCSSGEMLELEATADIVKELHRRLSLDGGSSIHCTKAK
jgi:hypothetical protein